MLAYSVLPVSMTSLPWSSLVIGCVDNGPARKEIAKKFSTTYGNPPAWWIDSGNGENFGQVLIGNARDASPKYLSKENVYARLPLTTLQRPDLLKEAPPARDCAEIAEQGQTINQSMAALVIEATRRLIAGTCSWMQLYLDMNLGTLQPVFATPETIKEIEGNKFGKGRRPN